MVRREFCYTVPEGSEAEMDSYVHAMDGFIQGVIGVRHARAEKGEFDPASRKQYVWFEVSRSELQRLIADLAVRGIKPVGD